MQGVFEMADLNALQRDLVTANHILAREGVTDALGHVSVRHPDRSDRFFLSCSRSPELVKLDDIMEYDLDCNPIDQRGRPMYFERPIHGAIYQARPDVISVVHNHAYEVIPFGLTKRPLKACVHPACGIGAYVPVWDSRTSFGDTDLLITNMERGKDLARGMGKNNSVLLRGHGCVVVGGNLREAVLNAIYFKINASLVLQSMQIGDDITYLSEGEIERTKKLVYADNSVTRMWDYWSRRCGDRT
jgi:ribulose-5-phosphate 4-epimerase/fuculose-1-phosphate aldolase